jgi:drug/metabolite transporter (DMT)-like permease
LHRYFSNFFKIASTPGTVSAFYRVFFAGLALFPLRLTHKKQSYPTRKSLRLIILGGLVFAMKIFVWNTAILLTSAAKATLLSNNSPLWVGLGAMLLFREKLPLRYWVGLLIALTGMSIIVGGNMIQKLQFNTGDLLAVVASVLYAAFMLITQKARARTDTLTLNLLTMLTSSIVLLPMVIIFGHTLAGFSTSTWLALLGLGLIPQFIGWLAINYAMGHLPAARVSVMLLGQPVVTAILGILVLHESLSLTDISGGMLVLNGIYLVNQRTNGKTTSDAYTQSA